jgi:replicative DNA helicase
MCRRLYAVFGLDLVIVDYVQLMIGDGRSENRVQEVSGISRSVKALARELNVPVIAVAQLSRSVEQRQDKRPMLSDLRESGCLTGDSRVTIAEDGATVPMRELVGRSGFCVWALNPQSLKLEAMPVSRAFSTGIKPIYRLTTRLGRSIRATANHRFLTIHGWKRLDELEVGDYLALPRALVNDSERTMRGAETVAALAESDVYWDLIDAIEPGEAEEVFDLTVPGHHNFVVNDIIAHNSLEQDADVVMFIHREEMYDPETERKNMADIIISKHRNGPTGDIELFFDGAHTQFHNAMKSTHELELLVLSAEAEC